MTFCDFTRLYFDRFVTGDKRATFDKVKANQPSFGNESSPTCSDGMSSAVDSKSVSRRTEDRYSRESGCVVVDV